MISCYHSIRPISRPIPNYIMLSITIPRTLQGLRAKIGTEKGIAGRREIADGDTVNMKTFT